MQNSMCCLGFYANQLLVICTRSLLNVGSDTSGLQAWATTTPTHPILSAKPGRNIYRFLTQMLLTAKQSKEVLSHLYFISPAICHNTYILLTRAAFTT